MATKSSAAEHTLYLWPGHFDEKENIAAGLLAALEEVGISDVDAVVLNKEDSLPEGCMTLPVLKTEGNSIFGTAAIGHYVSYLKQKKMKKGAQVDAAKAAREDEALESAAEANLLTAAKRNADKWQKATKQAQSICTAWERRSNISATDEIAKYFQIALDKLGLEVAGGLSVRKASVAVNKKKKKMKKKKGKKGTDHTDNSNAEDTATSKHHFQIDASVAFGIFAASKKGGDNVRQWKSPMEVANAIVEALPKFDATCEVAKGAPFINITVTKEFISSRVLRMIKLGIPRPTIKKSLKVAVDYSSPNIAKDMHVGHLRSSIIGDAVCRVLEFCGHEIVRLNHVGDWGTQFGMLIAYLKREYPDFLENPPNITDLTLLYKESKKVFSTDKEFKKISQLEVVKLQAGDPTNRRIWKKLCELSEQMFQVVYKRLGIHPDLKIQGESFYNDKIPATIADLTKKGLVTVSEGAKVVWVKDESRKKMKKKKKKEEDGNDEKKDGPPPGMKTVPLMAVKSDGGYGYDSTDLAAVRYRLEHLKCDWVIYCVDAGQQLHFELIFGAAKMAGWAQPSVHRLDHVKFGVVCGEDGKRIKTRSGKSVRLVDLLDEGVRRCTETLKQRLKNESTTCKLREDQIDEVASKLAHGCVKYFDLRLNRINDYVFSFDKMLSPDGDTNVYLQQQHARICSIFRKAKAERNVESALALVREGAVIDIVTKEEEALAMQIISLPDVIRCVSNDLLPSSLCTWLFSLCKKLASFYAACNVLNGKEMKSRLLLLEAAAIAMRQVMALIGIEALREL
eukprot:g2365.t1